MKNVCVSGATTTRDHEKILCENVDRGSAYSVKLIDIDESSDSEED